MIMACTHSRLDDHGVGSSLEASMLVDSTRARRRRRGSLPLQSGTDPAAAVMMAKNRTGERERSSSAEVGVAFGSRRTAGKWAARVEL